MELKKLIDDLSQELFNEMCQGCEYDDYYSIALNTESNGYINVWYGLLGGLWDIEVTVEHGDDNNRHETPNLEEFLESRIDIDWDAVKEYWRDNNLDEWQAHGFRDEADFWHWKEG